VHTSQCKHPYFCWICGSALDLETCNSDEQGIAVHENCYFLKVALATESMRLLGRKPVQRVRRGAEPAAQLRKARSSTR